MIVYRSAARTVSPARWLAALHTDVLTAARATPSHDEVRELLIEVGALEAAVADAMNPVVDDMPDPLMRLREAICLLGHALRISWHDGDRAAVRTMLARAARVLGQMEERTLPRTARAGTAEGYAYYALYPEGHLEAARRLARVLRPVRAVCIGVRGIGTSLSAAAVAALEAEGCPTSSYTVRPHGHPFTRRVSLAPALRDEWRAAHGALFIIADEGPGLSGSSLACVAHALEALGVPDDRIIYLPSWLPDPDRLLSPLARDHWGRHRKYVQSFEALLLDSGRLAGAHAAPDAQLTDLSAGAWRTHWVLRPRDYPAVQPQHERRKYMLRPRGRAESPGDGARLLKFAGLGSRGRVAYTRALRLAEAGFAPRPIALAEGFLALELAEGVPLTASDVTPVLLDRMAEYLAFLQHEFRTSDACDADALREMVEVNVGEGVGIDPTPALARCGAAGAAVRDAPAVALDGRMLPHEWLRCGDDFIKTDGLEHHDDHFQPGPHDIAWDLAATAEEFALAPSQFARLTERYRALSGDRSILQRLPLHRTAYLAFRLGYSRLASDALPGSDDGERWRRLARRYEVRLRRALASASRAA